MLVFNFGVGSLKQSVKLGWFIIFDFLGNSPLKTPLFPNWQPKSSAFYSVFIVWAVFQLLWWEKTYLKCRPLFHSQIFKFCCNIQGLHLIGYLWVSLIIDQSECLICYFLCTELTLFCTELTLFCTELSENCIYLNQSNWVIFSCISTKLQYHHLYSATFFIFTRTWSAHTSVLN